MLQKTLAENFSIMKLIRFLLIVAFVQLSTKALSQVTLNEKNIPVTRVMAAIEKQTGYLFIYDETKVKLGNVSVMLKNAPLGDALGQCFKDLPVTFRIIEKTIVLKPKKEEKAIVDTEKNQQTFSINGRITDENGAPLPGVFVFLTNSKKTTATNADGIFSLSQVQPGNYELVAKMVGFDSYIKNIIVQKQSVNVFVKLLENITGLNEIVIKTAPDPSRSKYLKIFTKTFIGESANASGCKILNPEVIVLHYDKKKKTLEARSNDFIRIENLSLGYKVSFLLTHFEFDTKTKYFAYKGNPYFEELAGSADQQKKWDYARKIAYEGSIRHFFKALFNGTAEAEGFSVYRLPVNQRELTGSELLNQQTEDKTPFKKMPSKLNGNIINASPLDNDSLFSVIDKNFKLLKLTPANEPANAPTRLYIVYSGEQEPGAFYNSDEHIDFPINSSTKKSQVSQLDPIKKGIKLDKNGNLSPPDGILFPGYWTWERMADLMPFDYNPVKPSHTPIPNTRYVFSIYWKPGIITNNREKAGVDFFMPMVEEITA